MYSLRGHGHGTLRPVEHREAVRSDPIMPYLHRRPLVKVRHQRRCHCHCQLSLSGSVTTVSSWTLPSTHSPFLQFTLRYPLCKRDREQSIFFMSSTGQATSSFSHVQLIIDALTDYSKETGIDLSKYPIAVAFEQSNSSEAILQLFQQRESAFKEYRDGNRKLINCLSPAVRILQAFSGILGGVASLVRHTYHLVTLLTWSRQVPFPPANALLAGIDALLAVRPLNMYSNRLPCNA